MQRAAIVPDGGLRQGFALAQSKRIAEGGRRETRTAAVCRWHLCTCELGFNNPFGVPILFSKYLHHYSHVNYHIKRLAKRGCCTNFVVQTD
jgi:hypothetical protein